MSRFEHFLEVGKLGELLVASWLKSRGLGVIPSTEFSGKNGDKAPRLHFEARSFVTPDLDVCRNGSRYWVEVKTYESAAWNRKRGCFVHGIRYRHLKDYDEVAHSTGNPAYILVLELEDKDEPGKWFSEAGRLLSIPVNKLQPPTMTLCQCGCGSVEGTTCTNRSQPGIVHGCYWPRDAMKPVHRFALDEIQHIREFKAKDA